MTSLMVAAVLVFVFSTVLTVAGLGTAFIVIPTFYWLGTPLAEAMAIALLLNVVSLSLASIAYIRNRLIDFRAVLPTIIVAVLLAPLGALSVKLFDKNLVLFLFSVFLLFAGSMMLFYKPMAKPHDHTRAQEVGIGLGVGTVAGYLGGLLGVGGGNFILPSLVWLGFNPKVAAATTSFAVIFISLSGFLGHAGMGNINWPLLSVSLVASVTGALLGSWLMSKKLDATQVKKVIGVVLYVIAAKMLWGVVA